MEILSLFKQKSDNENQPLWHKTNISFGVQKNKIIEHMIQQNGLVIGHQNIDEAFLRLDKIILPFKTRFSHESHYYHAVLHEFAHFKSEQLGQALPLKEAFRAYSSTFGEKVDTNYLLGQIKTSENFLLADKTIQNVLKTYMHEEAKCEVAAFQLMEHAKMQITKVNETNVMSSLNLARKILSIDGRDLVAEFKNKDSQISKELKTLSDSMCKDYDIAKERVLKKEREHER